MKFYITISLAGIPTTPSIDFAQRRFPDLPKERGDMLVTITWESPRSICHRDGRIFSDENEQRGPGETIVLVFDDFVPGITQDSRPEWYELLWERILSVQAEAEYGPDHGVKVTNEIRSGCAVGMVRQVPIQFSHQKQLCHCIKINATGNCAFADAMELHQLILAGDIE